MSSIYRRFLFDFYQNDLVNSKTPSPPPSPPPGSFHSARYIFPPLFTSPSGNSCIIFLPNQTSFFVIICFIHFTIISFCSNVNCFPWESTDHSASMNNLWQLSLKSCESKYERSPWPIAVDADNPLNQLLFKCKRRSFLSVSRKFPGQV